MARSFIGFGQQAYIGVPQALPIKLAGISGQTIPLQFFWISYGASSSRPNINVLCDFSGKSCAPLDQIRSIYIDNLGSNIPIYVYFPDTGTTVVAKPNSEGWYPAYTNSRSIWVIGEGFTTANVPTTVIQVSNIPLPPGVNNEIDTSTVLWLASSSISRGATIYNTNFGTPALGDQFSTTSLDVNLNTTQPVFGTPRASGFIYITACSLTLLNYGAGVASSNNFFFESTGVAGQFFSFGASATSSTTPNVAATLLNIAGQWKLDATQQWQVRSTLLSGSPTGLVVFNFSFTTNPN